jgi:outer membrane murein-binding lipoprotein Lpp
MRMLGRLIEVMVIGAVALLLAFSWLSLGKSASQDPDTSRRAQSDVRDLNKRFDSLKSDIEKLNKQVEAIGPGTSAASGSRPDISDLFGRWVAQGTGQSVTIDRTFAFVRVNDSRYGYGSIEESSTPAPGADFIIRFRDQTGVASGISCFYSITREQERMHWTPGKNNPIECRPETDFYRQGARDGRIRARDGLIKKRHRVRCRPCHPCWRYHPCWYRPCWW